MPGATGKVEIISIHSPLTRGDRIIQSYNHYHDISIHSPLTRGDYLSSFWDFLTLEFQSTPLSRGETCIMASGWRKLLHFNPLPSHEGRRRYAPYYRPSNGISIHSPLTRGDRLPIVRLVASLNFNPLPSHEGRR